MGEKFSKVLNNLQKDPSTSGSLLRAFRRGLSLTQEELAEITGLQSTNISAIENEKIPMTGHYADMFAAALGIHPRILLYPNGKFHKSAELKLIEKRAQRLLKKKVG